MISKKKELEMSQLENYFNQKKKREINHTSTGREQASSQTIVGEEKK